MNLEASFARCCALACVSLFTIAAAFAQEFPAKPWSKLMGEKGITPE